MTSSETPINISAWSKVEIRTENRDFVINGLRQGFRLGISNTSLLHSSCRALRPQDLLLEKVMEGIQANGIIRPFKYPPFSDLHISPLRMIEKKVAGKFRLIHNFFSPSGHSVNDSISDELNSVKYCKVSDVVDYLLKNGSKRKCSHKIRH